jgi:RNA polymerase sigma factor (TIGR02999 family)
MGAEITRLLREARNGGSAAQSQLASAVYDELHRLGLRFMLRERRDHTLQPTLLANDAFIKLVDETDRTWQNRSHFFAVAAQVMRRLLIDYARRHRTAKKGGGTVRIEWDDAMAITEQNCEQWLAVDEALKRLADRDEQMGRIVEMRFFGGLTEEEIAEVLGVNARTVKRDWRVAKRWLREDLSPVGSDDNGTVGTGKSSHR